MSSKPTFLRQDIHKKGRLKRKWRKPRGMDSKLRLRLKGHCRKPSSGYGSPVKSRYQLKGIYGVVVSSVKDLDGLDTTKQGAILSSKIGKKRRVEIIKECVAKKIKVINVKDTQEYLKGIEEWLSAKKKEKEKKKKVEKKEVKGKEKKEDLAEKVKTEEEKKDEEKKQKDKMLTKKDTQ
ncbi:eL32 family ribosomal protein [Nanoarchaeota archaeon]